MVGSRSICGIIFFLDAGLQIMNVINEIRNAFNVHAHDYKRAAFVQHEIGLRLLARLDYMLLDPRYILDLGCGPGIFSQSLKQRYPNAQIIGLDFALEMLSVAKESSGASEQLLVNADMHALPIADMQFDLIFANQALHWTSSWDFLLRELYRVLAPGGCLMFTTLGPDTFMELRYAFSLADQHAHVNDFMDLHNIGDALLAQGYTDPVVDMEMLTVHYPTLSQLLHSLKDQGVRHINRKRNPGLTGRNAWQRFSTAMNTLQTADAQYPLSYEVVYGHAWKSGEYEQKNGTETTISMEQMKRLLSNQ